MKFISAKEAAEKWKISSTMVIRLARKGKIPGAQLIGNSWIIPADAERTKRNCLYKYPIMAMNKYTGDEIKTFPKEEQILYQGEMLYGQFKLDEAKKILEKLLKKTDRIYIKIGALYTLIYTYLCLGDYDSFEKALCTFELIFNEQFDKKEEMMPMLAEFGMFFKNTQADFATLEMNFSIEKEYSKTAEYVYMLSTAYLEIVRMASDNSTTNMNVFEFICKRILEEGYLNIAAILSLYIGYMYMLTDDKEKADTYFRQAISLAYKTGYYAPIINYSMTCYQFIEPLLEDYPENFRNLFAKYHAIFRDNYKNYLEKRIGISFYKNLDDKDYKLIQYAIAGVPNKRIAELEQVSESKINKDYLSIYDKLEISGKKQLKKLATATIFGKR